MDTGGFLAADQNGGRHDRSYLGCGGSSDLGWRTFGPAERAPNGIHNNVLGPAYHFLRQVAIRQLQRIVAKMIENSVCHLISSRTFADVPFKFFYGRQRDHYISRTNGPLQMRQKRALGIADCGPAFLNEIGVLGGDKFTLGKLAPVVDTISGAC
jgi:hypothetical protein